MFFTAQISKNIREHFHKSCTILQDLHDKYILLSAKASTEDDIKHLDEMFGEYQVQQGRNQAYREMMEDLYNHAIYIEEDVIGLKTHRESRVMFTQKLEEAGIIFESKNNGVHLKVKVRNQIIDYWPSTNKIKANGLFLYDGFNIITKQLL